MILEQNHIKIVQYTQKAFKIYCRRSLAGAIIKALQKRTIREKEKYIDDADDYNLATNSPKIQSERSIAYLSGGREQSVDGDSATSQMKKTINIVQKNDKNKQNTIVLDRLQIMYGDLVYIEFNSENNNENMRAKHFLNKLKFCCNQAIGVGSSSDLRCVFEIVYPGADLQNQKKGTLVTESSLICLRTISKKQYVKVKGGKIVYSDQFGKQLQLTKQLNQCCVFQLKYAEQTLKEQIIVSGEQIFIKMFGQDLYMNVLKNQQQIFFSQAPAVFTLKKLKRKLQSFVPSYFKMKSNKFQTNILANPIDLQPISQKKTMVNVVAINQNNVQNKINPITFIHFDFSKVPEQDFKITNSKDLSSNNVLNCWELIECPNKSDSNLYQLYNPMVGLGLIIKPLKNLVRLTPNQQDFSVLRLSYKDDDIISFGLEQGAQELDIIYDRLIDKYVIVLYKAQSQNSSKLFKIKQINTNSSYMICQMTEIFDILKSVYEFLNTWGNQFDEKSQTVFYSVKQIKLGSSMMLKKIRQMRMVFKILKNYLQNPQYSVQQIQNTINSMKILQMIINICKIITNKIGYIYPNLQQDSESPFCFAKNNLEEVLKSMFIIILKLTKDNIPNSTAVISEVNYFNNILRSYPEQIGQILQQSIKNLSVFSTKSNANGSNQLFIWVKLIQPIKEDTVKIQKTYIQIIAQAVIDPNDRGIPQYQNKCKQLLFIQNSKRKGIPKFGMGEENNLPIITFESYANIKQFFGRNNYLGSVNLADKSIKSISFTIQNFFGDKYSAGSEIMDQYVGYIGSIIKMFRNLCRNRNKKLFKIVDDWGITQQHIQAIFNSPKISWQLKTSYLSLWTAIYIDEDPFLPFEKRESKCHYWPKIGKYNLQDCTALVFKQYTDEAQAISKLNDFGSKIYPILSQFFHNFKKRLPNVLGDITELKCLLIVLNTIYEMMNLGYMTVKAMKDYIGISLHLISGIEQGMFAKKSNEQQLMKFHHSILVKFIKILILYENVWVQIYGIEILQNFYKQTLNKNYTMSRQAMQSKWQNIIKNKFEQNNHGAHSSKAHSRKRTRFNAFSQTQNSLLTGRGDHLNFQIPLNFQQIDNEIIDFIINLLTKRILQHKCESHQQLISLINKKIQRRERVCNYLKWIMILNNQKQQQIYRNFSGRESNKLLNWLKIQQIVHKITEIQSNNSNDEVELRCRKQKILQLNNILVKIIREMKIYKGQNLKMLRKCQLVLQKLKVHSILMDLLKFSDKPAYKDLMKTIFQFFCQFMVNNQFNCKALVPHTDKFIKNLNYEGLTFILPTLISINENKEFAYKIAHQLVFKINQSQTTVYLLMIFDKLLNLNQNSQQTYQLKNHLARRIIEQFKLKIGNQKQQSQNIIQNQMGEYQNILNSFQFAKILCKLSFENPQLEQYIKYVHTKCGLLQKLKNNQNYDDKKLFLKILVEIYIRKKQLQNFQIEDYFQMLIIKQLKKLPHICIKLAQQNSITSDQQNQINSLYEELQTISNVKISTKDEQTYLNYILDFNDISEISILSFARIIISKWKGQQKSQRLQKCRNYFKKLQQFLYLIFYIKNSTYQRNIFEEIETVNIGLQNIVVESQNQPRWQRKLDQATKDEVIKFYNTLSKIIVEQGISAHALYECFGIQPQRMQMKRSNHSISQSQFVQCLNKLKKLTKKQQQYKSIIMQSVQLFRFISVNKDTKSKLIDIHFVMDKLISLMQYNKNMRIKKQMPNKKSQEKDKDNQQQRIEQHIPQNFNVYTQNQQVNQKQFALQVQTFCELSQKYKQVILQNMNKRIKESVNGLKKKKIIEWLKDSSMNILNISQHYQCTVLYSFLLAVLDRAVETPYQMAIINEEMIKSIIQYLKSINGRFKTKNQKHLLVLYNEIHLKFSSHESIIEKIQKVTERAYDTIIMTVTSTKSEQNIQLIKLFKTLFVNLVNNPATSENYKMKMKYKMVEMIKKLINKGINVSCLYDYRIMEAMLYMWSENELMDEVENSALIQDADFIRWVEKILSKRSLQEMTGSNSRNVNKSKFALLISKVIIKYEENHQNHHITLSKSITKIQQSACELFEQFVMPKKQAHTQQLYCLNTHECSQFFCNYQRLTAHDQNILNLLLSLFIITRIYMTKYQNYTSINQTKQKNNIDWTIRGLVGHIKYRMYDKDKNYNFKLPSCHLFTNSDIEDNIINQMVKIPSEYLYMYLHPLSKIFAQEISIISALSGQFAPLRYLVQHKNMVKKIMLILYTLMLLLQLNGIINAPFGTHSNSSYSNHPVIQIACLVSLFIYAIYYVLEIRLFKNYCLFYYPLKYAHTSEDIDEDIYAETTDKYEAPITIDKQQNPKNNAATAATKKDINEAINQISSAQNINISNPKNYPEVDKTQPSAKGKANKSLTVKHVLLQLIKSNIPLHTALLVVYMFALFNTSHLVMIVMLQIYDLETSSKLMRSIRRGFIRCKLQHIFLLILLDYSFMYMASIDKYKDLKFVDLLRTFMLKVYSVTLGGQIQPIHSQFDFSLLQLLFQAVIFVNVALLAFYYSETLFQYKKEAEKMHNKCWICLKNKTEIQQKQKFKYHLTNEHKLWDYMYFFIQFDRKGKLEGIGTQIEQQIANQDYRFIKLH